MRFGGADDTAPLRRGRVRRPSVLHPGLPVRIRNDRESLTASEAPPPPGDGNPAGGHSPPVSTRPRLAPESQRRPSHRHRPALHSAGRARGEARPGFGYPGPGPRSIRHDTAFRAGARSGAGFRSGGGRDVPQDRRAAARDVLSGRRGRRSDGVAGPWRTWSGPAGGTARSRRSRLARAREMECRDHRPRPDRRTSRPARAQEME